MLTFLNVSGLVHVVDEPELRYTPSKKAVVSFTVASNRSWTDQAGTRQEDRCFISCTAWGKLAENIDKYVGKGDPLYIDGSLRQESWEKDDQKHTKHSLNLDHAYFLKLKTE